MSCSNPDHEVLLKQALDTIESLRKEKALLTKKFEAATIACKNAVAIAQQLESAITKAGGSVKIDTGDSMKDAIAKGLARGVRSSAPGNVRDAGALIEATHQEAVAKGRIEKQTEKKPIGFGEALLKGRSARLT